MIIKVYLEEEIYKSFKLAIINAGYKILDVQEESLFEFIAEKVLEMAFNKKDYEIFIEDRFTIEEMIDDGLIEEL